jgi:hypothetical protein
MLPTCRSEDIVVAVGIADLQDPLLRVTTYHEAFHYAHDQACVMPGGKRPSMLGCMPHARTPLMIGTRLYSSILYPS